MKNRVLKISSIMSLILSVIMLAAVSFAWLSMNKETTSNGMELQVEASANLIISNNTSEIVKATIETINTNSPFSITHASNSSTYQPATHDSDYTTYATGLKYVSNTEEVSVTTGLQKGENALTFSAVSSATPSGYYVDFVVYVASYAKPMTGAKLKIKLLSATKDAVEVTSGSLMATSVDVYAGTTVSLANYRGTLNVASKDTTALYLFDTANHGSTSATGDIPHNQAAAGDKYLTYTLRCYFDGDLTSSGTAYINTATLDTSKVTLSVMFFIED